MEEWLPSAHFDPNMTSLAGSRETTRKHHVIKYYLVLCCWFAPRRTVFVFVGVDLYAEGLLLSRC